MESLGTTRSVATAGPTYFCLCTRSGSLGAALRAWPYSANTPSVSSDCRDVALGISRIYNNGACHLDGCGDGFRCVGGAAPALGNDQMVVIIRGESHIHGPDCTEGRGGVIKCM